MSATPWEQKFFWPFIFRDIIATAVTIHGHMTSEMGMSTKDHKHLL